MGTAGQESGAFRGAVCDLFQAAESFVDCVGVRESFHELGRDENDVGSLLHAFVVFAANALAEVEGGALVEGIGFTRLLHIVESRLR